MNNIFQHITKISGPFFALSLMILIFSSCSQRIAGNFKTDRLETEQAVSLDLPENTEENTAANIKQEKEHDAVALATEEAPDKKEIPVLSRKAARKLLKEKITKAGDKKAEQLKAAALNTLPLLAINKSTKNIKSEKKPFRDYLVLGIVFLIVGIVAAAILPRPLDLVGSILALVGLILIVLYIVQVVL